MKNNIKAVISVMLIAVMLSVPLLITLPAAADNTAPTYFTSAEYASHWGRSDLRAYLNGAEKLLDTLPVSTEHTERQEIGYYESYFSDAEYALIQPFTYETYSAKSSSSYSATDKFWLPSGNYEVDKIISWGGSDIAPSNLQEIKSGGAYLIPISYWSYSKSVLRSAYLQRVLCSDRGNYITIQNNTQQLDISPAFKINISNVIFASAVSAEKLAENGSATVIDIAGSNSFGKKTATALPDYGMYLKTESPDIFDANAISLGGERLTIEYSGGVAGQYAVVQAYKSDNLETGTTVYAAAGTLSAGSTSISLDISSWHIESFENYTVKVWMEDTSSSPASATLPNTFVAKAGTFTKTNSGEAKNTRVFAMNNELQASWGDLSALDETDLGAVIDASAKSICGQNPTNQKIYFGIDSNGNPIQFWIAGRETAANGGTLSSSGNIMTLYAAKSVESKEFNASLYDYSEKQLPTITLADGQSADYTGTFAEFPSDKITVNDNSVDKSNLKWQHRAEGETNWTDGMPYLAGEWQVRAVFEELPPLEIFSNTVTYTVNKIDAYLSEYPRSITGLVYTSGEHYLITNGVPVGGSMRYKIDDGEWSEERPTAINAGNYTVYFKVVGDKNDNDTEPIRISATIDKMDPSLYPPEAISHLIYNGEPQTLIKAGSVSHGALQYRVNYGEWSEELPTATNAGNYVVYFRVVGDANHNGIESSIVAHIGNAEPWISPASAIVNLVYNGKPQALITAGDAVGGVMLYKMDDGEWSENIPTATDAGSYVVHFKAVGNENYNDTGVNYFQVTIAKRTVTVTAESKEIEQYSTLPEFTYKSDGFLADDGFITAPYIQKPDTDGKSAGEFTLTALDGVVGNNYRIVYESGTLTVTEHTEHKGGEATCTEYAVCALCGAEYEEPLGHTFDNDCDADCNVCDEEREPSEHINFKNDGVCDECGERLSLPLVAKIAIVAGIVLVFGAATCFVVIKLKVKSKK